MKKTLSFLMMILFVCAGMAACRPVIIQAPAQQVEQPTVVATPRPRPLAIPQVLKIAGYAVDYTDGTIGFWNSPYPHPSFDDEKGRRGLPNGEWDGSYYFEGNTLCLVIDNLFIKHPPAHTLGIGYRVTLRNATFADGSITKKFILFKYTGRPIKKKIIKKVGIIPNR